MNKYGRQSIRMKWKRCKVKVSIWTETFSLLVHQSCATNRDEINKFRVIVYTNVRDFAVLNIIDTFFLVKLLRCSCTQNRIEWTASNNDFAIIRQTFRKPPTATSIANQAVVNNWWHYCPSIHQSSCVVGFVLVQFELGKPNFITYLLQCIAFIVTEHRITLTVDDDFDKCGYV